MKTVLTSNQPTFAPAGAGAGTLTFTNAVNNLGFSFGRLMAVINLTQNALIYAATATGLGGTWNSGASVLTLATSTTGHNSGDTLEVIWDDPKATVTLDAPLSTAPAQGWPSTFKLTAASSTNATVVKSTAGTLGAVTFEPSASCAAASFLKIYDKSTAPVAGDTPKLTFFMAPFASAPKTFFAPPAGVKFVNGISIAITASSSDAALTNTVADYAIVNLAYA